MTYTVNGNKFEIDFDEIEWQLSNKALATMEVVQAYVCNRDKGGIMTVTAGEWFVEFMKTNRRQEEIVNWFESPRA